MILVKVLIFYVMLNNTFLDFVFIHSCGNFSIFRHAFTSLYQNVVILFSELQHFLIDNFQYLFLLIV